MSKLIVCNWKENPSTLREALALAKASDAPHAVIAPPYPFLGAVRTAAVRATMAAQDVFHEPSGAFTGAVSASQLSSVGVSHVIVGHSERRKMGDTDEIVAKKIKAALHASLTPILCVGESRAHHDAGRTEEILLTQLSAALSLMEERASAPISFIVAYEPVWAISAAQGASADTPQNALRMIDYAKRILESKGIVARYIYGGSVNEKNIESFLQEGGIEGVLVGSASLKEEKIKKIIEIAGRY